MSGVSRRISTADAMAVILLFAGGCLVHGGFLFSAAGRPWWISPILDGRVFDEAGRRIAAGEWLLPAGFPQTPLYPYLVGGIYALLGTDPWMVRVAQGLAGALVPPLLFIAGSILAGRTAGIAAGALAVVCGPLVAQASDLTPATASVVAMTVLLLLFLPPVRGVPASVARGAATAALVYLRPNMILFIPVPFVFSLLREGARRRAAVAFLAGGVAVAAPFLLQDLLSHQAPRPVAAHWGVNLYLGNNPSATGAWQPLSGQTGDVESTNLAPPPGAGWVAEVIGFWTHHPLGALALTGRKAFLLINQFEVPLNLPFPVVREEVRLLRWLPVGFGLLMPLVVYGWLALPAAGSAERFCRWTLVVGLASVLPFFVADRYRLCLFPPALLLAGAGVSRLLAPLAGSRRAVALGAACIAGIVSCWPTGILLENDRMTYHYNAGVNLLAAKRDREADTAFAGVTGGPLRVMALVNRSSIALRRGNPAAAVPLLGAAAADEPANPVVLHNMILALDRSGGDAAAWRGRYRAATGREHP